MGTKLSNELTAWGVLAITLVLTMIILGKFKDISGSTASTNTTIDNFLTGLAEPASWVAIVVIALVGFGIIKYVKGKNN